MYVRMLTYEGDHTGDFLAAYDAGSLPGITDAVGFRSSHAMTEEAGRSAVILSLWRSRDDCLTYHSSLAYRKHVERAFHTVRGDLTVRLFNTV